MSFVLTEQQQHELEAAGDVPVRVVIEQSKRQYVVIPVELYDRLSSLTEDLTMEQVGDLVERSMSEYDQDDPTLEGYQKYHQ